MMSSSEYPDHWQLGCSNAGRWVRCPGSKYAVDDREPGHQTKLGTLGHKIVEQLLRGQQELSLDENDKQLLAETSRDQREWFKSAIKTCVTYVQLLDVPSEMLLEVQIKSKRIDDHGGTVDVILYFRNPSTATCDAEKLLHVVDFKFGNTPVPPGDNYQLMAYLNLARQLYPDAERFFATIVQPAYRGAETVDYTIEQLDEFLVKMAVAADPPNMQLNAGSWCEWCPLVSQCTEAAKLTQRAMRDFGVIKEKVVADEPLSDDDIETLERVMMVHKIADTAIKGASAMLKSLHDSGRQLHYHKVTSTSRRDWKPGAADALVEQLGNAALRPVTVTDAQKISGLDKKEFDELFAEQLQWKRTPRLVVGTKPEADALAEFEPI